MDDDYGAFGLVENRRSDRPDLHAFMLLDELFPDSNRCMISSASHDEVWLDVSLEKVETLTDEQITELVRCGLLYDYEHCCLMMFV